MGYHRIAPAVLHALQVRAVVISGHVTTMDHYVGEDLAGVCAVLREEAWPTLSSCGGCQLLAHTYGAHIGPIGPLAPFDPSSLPVCNNTLDVRQERGFLPVYVVHAHTLFEGLTSEPVFFQSHYWEVKAAPPGFRVCAESLCLVCRRLRTTMHRCSGRNFTRNTTTRNIKMDVASWRIFSN